MTNLENFVNGLIGIVGDFKDELVSHLRDKLSFADLASVARLSEQLKRDIRDFMESRNCVT